MNKNRAASITMPGIEPIKVDLAEVAHSFEELFDLLEDYAPMWYSEDVHDRAQSALILLRASLGVEPPQKSHSKRHKSLEYSLHNG